MISPLRLEEQMLLEDGMQGQWTKCPSESAAPGLGFAFKMDTKLAGRESLRKINARLPLDTGQIVYYMEAVFKRFGHGLLIVALLGATGGYWAMLQSVAWATMLASNVRTGCLADAIVKTFDGKHPCPLCRQIAQGRQSEKKSDAQAESKKLEYSLQPAVFVLCPPSHFFLLGERSSSAPLLTESPPTPPPRELPA